MSPRRARLSTTQRGYGWAHQRRRWSWERRVAAGVVDCARCGERIVPGEPWDLGHRDGSAKTVYAGPEHRRCNRATSTHRILREEAASERRQSREW